MTTILFTKVTYGDLAVKAVQCKLLFFMLLALHAALFTLLGPCYCGSYGVVRQGTLTGMARVETGPTVQKGALIARQSGLLWGVVLAELT